ncbi:MAG: hypothetical protein ACYTG4_06200 [Planctomycetota bacterium]|jgi:hypothetical protein
MARSRVPIFPIVVAVGLLVAGAWWMLRADEADRVETTLEEMEGGRETARDSTMEGQLRDALAENGEWPDGTSPAPAGALPPSEATFTVTARLESGRPLPGVFLTTLIDRAMGIELATRSEIIEFMPTDGEGRTEASATEDGDSLRVRHPFADLVAAEGAEIIEPDEGKGSSARVRLPGGPVTLTFREQEGWAHLRLVDKSTGKPVTEFKEMRVAYEFDPEGKRSIVYRWGAERHQSGWITLPESSLPEGSAEHVGESLSNDMNVAVRVPGYEEVRTRLADLRGWVEVHADPVEADVVGIIYRIRDTLRIEDTSSSWTTDLDLAVSVTLRSLDESRMFVGSDVQGMPATGGKFSLYGLPEGHWELEVLARTDAGGLLRTSKRFRKRDVTVDVGDLVLRYGAGIEVRFGDAGLTPLPQADLVIVRSDEDPAQGRRLELDDGGRVRLSDLEPGATYRVVARGLPGTLEKLVVAPEREATTSVELRWPERAVECALKFRLGSQVFQGRLPLDESPVPTPRQQWDDNGTLRTRLVPGDYTFSFFAEDPDGQAVKLTGSVTVPSDEEFAATVEMRRDP